MFALCRVVHQPISVDRDARTEERLPQAHCSRQRGRKVNKENELFTLGVCVSKCAHLRAVLGVWSVVCRVLSCSCVRFSQAVCQRPSSWVVYSIQTCDALQGTTPIGQGTFAKSEEHRAISQTAACALRHNLRYLRSRGGVRSTSCLRADTTRPRIAGQPTLCVTVRNGEIYLHVLPNIC